MTVLIDLSSHNAAPNWAALKAGGVAGVILKATEGVGYINPTFAPWRAAAHAAGLAVGCYHFARDGDPAAEAAWFTQTAGPLAPGEFVALDWEVPAADPVGWCAAWADAATAHGTGPRLLYLNRSTLAGHDWSPLVARGVLLWLASYDGSQITVPGAGSWPAVTVKQYSDAATVPGEAGQVDANVLFAPLTALTGAAPTPTPAGDDMDAVQAAQLDSITQWTDPNNGYVGVTVRQLEAQIQQLAGAVQALAQTVAALPAQTAQALPAMACQGNPKAVLGALGSAATAAAASAT